MLQVRVKKQKCTMFSWIFGKAKSNDESSIDKVELRVDVEETNSRSKDGDHEQNEVVKSKDSEHMYNINKWKRK